jgi:Ethanolamine utilization protein EutJ (predicted chaperonin)
VPTTPGTTNLKIYKDGKVIYEKDLYVGSGQIRKIKI